MSRGERGGGGGRGRFGRLLADPRVRGAGGVAALFLAVQLLALAIAPRLAGSGVSYGEGGDALVPLVLGLAAGTLLSLAVVRRGASPRLVRGVMLVSLGAAQWFAFAAFLPPLPAAGAAAAGVLLAWRLPRPAVRNAAAAVGAAGGAGLFGASLGPPYAAGALVIAAAYDLYAVYGSGHMTEMADAGASMRVPSMFVVPTDAGYDDDELSVGGGGAPAAAVLGAGDALFPALFAASVAVRPGAVGVVPGPMPAVLGVPLPAVLTAGGALAGLLALQVLVHRRAGVHAGLPWVNGGALAGYAVWLALAAGLR